jgi:amidohydrolase
MPGDSGKIYYRARGYYAAADRLTIRVKGVQTHGARPWAGVDIVSLGAEIALALNQVAARQLDVGQSPTVVTLATVHAGVRHNIIPEEMVMTGTLRTFDAERRRDVMARVDRTARSIAARYGATAEVVFDQPDPVTFNDPALTLAMAPSLAAAAGGPDKVEADAPVSMLAEDFPHFTKSIPGLYIQLGARKRGVDAASAPANHSPYFDIDEAAMRVGVRAYALLARDFLATTATTGSPTQAVLP